MSSREAGMKLMGGLAGGWGGLGWGDRSDHSGALPGVNRDTCAGQKPPSPFFHPPGSQAPQGYRKGRMQRPPETLPEQIPPHFPILSHIQQTRVHRLRLFCR